MAEEKKPQTEVQKTQRELFAERLRSKYPDQEFADDEAMYGRAIGDYDEYDKQLGDYKDREGRLTDLFAKDHRSAQFLTDMVKGKDPWIAVIERLGIDGVTDILNDPEKKEAYAEANQKYQERLVKEKELEEEYQNNIGASLNLLADIQKERGLTDEVVDAAWDMIQKAANEAIVGKVTTETINMALNAITHDDDVANAHEEGTVAGRNAKIEERLAKQKSGDGMPQLAGTPNGHREKPQKARSIFDVARGDE